MFSVTTHDPDTGVLTDADSVPTYRIYEQETGTAILSGSMAKLDDGNTTGFYTESIAITATNGFEHRKVYTVYISATVDSDTGGFAYNFTALTYPSWTAGAVSAAVSASSITQYQGTRWVIPLTIEDITGYSKVWFTVKSAQSHADTASLVQVVVTEPADAVNDGLLYINGVAGTKSRGSITVNSVTSITVTVYGVETAKLTPASDLFYDVKALVDATAGPDIVGEGIFTIDAVTTRATS